MAELRYHLRLTLRSVRRNPGIAAAVVGSLALATSMWTAAVSHSVRLYASGRGVSPALHHVELPHTETLLKVLSRTTANPSAWSTRARATFPEYELLAASGLPVRQTGTFRSHLVVASAEPGAAPAAVRRGRFVNADFFGLFDVPLAAGRPFTTEEERASAPVVVLGYRLAQALFGGTDGVGRSVLIEGRRFQVVGVGGRDQDVRPPWDITFTGTDQDALYLPFGWFRPLLARPEAVVHQAPLGPGFEDLLRGSSVFVSFWIELPDEQARAAYARYLADRFDRRGVHAELRSLPQWRLAFPVPNTPIQFFTLLTAFVLLAGGFNVTRLLLAKGLARRREHALHRALGASRRSLFARQMLEVALLALPGALVGTLLGIPYNELFNRLVADTDIPLRMTGLTYLCGAAPSFAVGVLAGVYPAWQASSAPTSASFGGGHT